MNRGTLILMIGLFLAAGTLAACSSESSIEVPTDSISGNPDVVRHPSPDQFMFDPVSDPDFYELLLPRVTTGMTAMWGPDWRQGSTWEQASKLRIWVRLYLDYGEWYDYEYGTNFYRGRTDYTNTADIADNLAWHDSGNEGRCGYYADVYQMAALACGLQVRRVGWYLPGWGGDQLVEVYIPELQKWGALSPLFNVWFSDVNGDPLSVVEMCDFVHDSQLQAIMQEYDHDLLRQADLGGVSRPWNPSLDAPTAPDGNPIRDFDSNPVEDEAGMELLIKQAAWDVYLATANGYAYQEAPVFIRYVSEDAWPYEIDPSLSFTTQSDRSFFEFDANLIRVGQPYIEAQTLHVPLEDYSVPNLASFEIRAYDAAGHEIAAGSFRSAGSPGVAEVGVDIDGAATVSVWAENQRAGKSNVVKIELP